MSLFLRNIMEKKDDSDETEISGNGGGGGDSGTVV